MELKVAVMCTDDAMTKSNKTQKKRDNLNRMVPYQYSMHTSCVNEQVHARVFNPTTATTTTEINLVFILIFFILKFQKKKYGYKIVHDMYLSLSLYIRAVNCPTRNHLWLLELTLQI